MNIVDDKYKEWTKGLTPLQARINVFNKIRDIPYAIVPEIMDYREYINTPIQQLYRKGEDHVRRKFS